MKGTIMSASTASKRRSRKTTKAKANEKPTKPIEADQPADVNYLVRDNPYGLEIKEPGYAIRNNLDDKETDFPLRIKAWREKYLPELGGIELVEICIAASIAGDSPYETPVIMKVGGPIGTIDVLAKEIERTVAKFAARLRAGMTATRRDVTFSYNRELESRYESKELKRIRKERMPEGKDHFRLALEIADTADGDYEGGAYAIQRFHIEANRGTIERASELLHELVTNL